MISQSKLFLAIGLFAVAQAGAWFQLNSQLVWKFWENKPLLSAIVYGIPTSMCFWYGWRIIAENMDSVWPARFMASSTGYMIFAGLTWYLLGESALTLKTMSCIFLAFLIILIQIYA